ncbi:hypothetical protein [Streptomyces sp. NPDC059371]|uniref:hypothetical protein n=1 Tax=Streptomyces sp. NPDC059371 TaxID=3346812 RepID=UPI0036CC9E03
MTAEETSRIPGRIEAAAMWQNLEYVRRRGQLGQDGPDRPRKPRISSPRKAMSLVVCTTRVAFAEGSRTVWSTRRGSAVTVKVLVTLPTRMLDIGDIGAFVDLSAVPKART